MSFSLCIGVALAMVAGVIALGSRAKVATSCSRGSKPLVGARRF